MINCINIRLSLNLLYDLYLKLVYSISSFKTGMRYIDIVENTDYIYEYFDLQKKKITNILHE